MTKTYNCKVCNTAIEYEFVRGGRPKQFCAEHRIIKDKALGTVLLQPRVLPEVKAMLEEMCSTEWGKVTAGEFISRLIIREYESRKK
jgi:hypothetical protein